MRKSTLLFASILISTGCSSISTNFDYDTSADFAALHTYQLLESEEQLVGSLLTQRIESAVNDDLTAKGYEQVTGDPAVVPDFRVAFHSGAQRHLQLDGYDDWEWNGATVYEYTQGTLVLDITDVKADKLIWRGTARGVVDPDRSPEEKTKVLDEAVAKMLKNFPPPKKE